MPSKEFQSSFNNGEISEDALARIEVARYPHSCRVLEHLIAKPVGGVTRRPAFRFEKETKDSATKDSVLIPYNSGQGFRFMLEMGDLYMRVFTDDGTPVNTAGGPELITNGDFLANILGWTDKSVGTGIFEWNAANQAAGLINLVPTDVAYFEQSIVTVIGATYQVGFSQEFNAAGDFTIRVGTTTGGAEVGETVLGSGTHVLQFVATAVSTFIGFKQVGQTSNPGPELVVNGNFDANILGWTNQSTGAGSISWSAGRMKTDSGIASTFGQYGGGYQAVPTVVGKEYKVDWGFVNLVAEISSTSEIRIGTTAGASDIFFKSYTTAPAPNETHTFTATTTTIYIAFRSIRGATINVNEQGAWDNVSVQRLNFGVLVDNVSVQLADSPFELTTTIPLAELDKLQYAQLEDGMLLTTDQIKLQHLVPTAPSVWTITPRDWEISQRIDGSAGGQGTNIGDMTVGGGLLAAFDKDTYKTGVQSAGGAASSFLIHVGKDWGAGNSKVLKGVVIFSSTDSGFFGTDNPEIIFRIQGSDDNFVDPALTFNLSESIVQDTEGLLKLEIFNLNDIRTPYRYHRVEMEIKASSANSGYIGELEFYEGIAENPPGLNDSSITFAPAIGRYQQRSITGGQAGHRATVYGTRSGDPLNMDQGDASDADGFQHELDQTGSIRWFADSDDLIVGTSNGVTRLRGTLGPLTAADKDAKADVAIGCAPIRPEKMSNSTLYIQTDRKRIQEVKIDEQGVKLAASDMNQLAEHIGEESPFKGCAAQPDPDKVLWCFQDSGNLVGFTFDRAEQLFAWHRHPMDNGQIISIRSLKASNGQTNIWAIIKRTINGGTKRSIEIMDKEVFSDGAVKYSGVPATTITGLGHLEGETVTVYGDGYFRGTFVVSGAQITIDEPMSEGDIGLGFIPKMTPVSPIRGQGEKTRFGPVLVKLKNTQSLWVNGKRQSFRVGASPMGQGVLFSGNKKVVVMGWGYDPEITFEAREPGPITILSYAGTMERSGQV